MPSELELKFRCDPPTLVALTAAGFDAGHAPARHRLVTHYYDTPDNALAAQGIALRVRTIGTAFVQTVKAGGDHFERFEFERPITSSRPERAALPDAQAPGPGAEVHRLFDRLEPVLRSDFERAAWRLAPTGDLTVELAIDRGHLHAGRRREPIAEVEIERLSGSRADFLRWARGFAWRHRLVLLLPTKAERGLRLAGRLPARPPVTAATAPAIDPEAGVATAARTALSACAGQMLANVEPLLQGTDAAGPHQFRVALRRLRAMIRLFRLADHDPRWRWLARAARHAADAAGAVRECDVLAAGPLAGLSTASPDDAALAAFARALQGLRESARLRLRELLGEPPFTRFVLSLALATSLLRDPPADGALPGHARAQARTLARRLGRRCRQAAEPAGWHRARIAAKNLRYTLETLAPALPRPRRALRVARRVAILQDRLGQDQDRAAGLALAVRIADHGGLAGTRRLRALSLIEGWYIREAAEATDPGPLCKAALAALRRALRRRR